MTPILLTKGSFRFPYVETIYGRFAEPRDGRLARRCWGCETEIVVGSRCERGGSLWGPRAWRTYFIQRTAVKFVFNGYPEEIEGCELTIQDLLDRTKEDDPAVIVEVNGRFVYRKDFQSITIREGDRVEFIHPSFGG